MKIILAITRATLSCLNSSFWDDATRKVVLDRVANVPPIRFFSPDQARLLETVCNHILPQDDRDPACSHSDHAANR